MDERSALHRYKSTSHAAVAAGLLLVAAGVKIVALVWYRFTD